MPAGNSTLQHVTHMHFMILVDKHTHKPLVGGVGVWGGQSRMLDEPQRDMGGSSHIPSTLYDAHM